MRLAKCPLFCNISGFKTTNKSKILLCLKWCCLPTFCHLKVTILSLRITCHCNVYNLEFNNRIFWWSVEIPNCKQVVIVENATTKRQSSAFEDSLIHRHTIVSNEGSQAPQPIWGSSGSDCPDGSPWSEELGWELLRLLQIILITSASSCHKHPSRVAVIHLKICNLIKRCKDLISNFTSKIYFRNAVFCVFCLVGHPDTYQYC